MLLLLSGKERKHASEPGGNQWILSIFSFVEAFPFLTLIRIETNEKTEKGKRNIVQSKARVLSHAIQTEFASWGTRNELQKVEKRGRAEIDGVENAD